MLRFKISVIFTIETIVPLFCVNAFNISKDDDRKPRKLSTQQAITCSAIEREDFCA